MSFVLDCSVTMAWCFADERTDATEALLEKLVNEGAHAPTLWPLEVTNVLLGAARKSRITVTAATEVALRISQLPVALDHEGTAQVWGETLSIASRYGLTSYDASYLELAVRKRLPIATLDKALRTAAIAHGVIVI